MLIFVDCEARGGAPVVGILTEFGGVSYPKMETYHGIIIARSEIIDDRITLNSSQIEKRATNAFIEFDNWLKRVCGNERPVFVSDNVAFDWQWINYGFHSILGYNPFGHSGRRISDFYAGLTGDWSNTQKWKRLRVTKHDHNPVHDAIGNAEAFRRIMAGER